MQFTFFPGLQTRMDGLISEIESGDGNTKLSESEITVRNFFCLIMYAFEKNNILHPVLCFPSVLKILTLQNQVEHLRRQLLDLDKLHISQVTRKYLQQCFTNLSSCLQHMH